jgi:hypothetical protein
MSPWDRLSYSLGVAAVGGLFGLASLTCVPASGGDLYRGWRKPFAHDCEKPVKRVDMYRLPPGVVGGAHFETMATNALQSKYVIYRHEWIANINDEGTRILGNAAPEDLVKLSRSGVQHLQAMASNLSRVNYPVILETSYDPELDEARRCMVLETLCPMLPEAADVNVVIAVPNEEGMRGPEAIRTFRIMEFEGNAFGRFGYGYGGFQTGFSGFGGGIY